MSVTPVYRLAVCSVAGVTVSCEHPDVGPRN